MEIGFIKIYLMFNKIVHILKVYSRYIGQELGNWLFKKIGS